jgi:hypothetical protein
MQPLEEVGRLLGLTSASNDNALGVAAGNEAESWWDSLRSWVRSGGEGKTHIDEIKELESITAEIEKLNEQIGEKDSKNEKGEVLLLNKQKQELVRGALKQANKLLLKAEALAKENPNAAKAVAFACEGAFLVLTPMLYVGSKALEYSFGEELSEYFDKHVAQPVLAQAGIKPGDEEYNAGKLVLETIGALATFKAHNMAVNKIAKATGAASKVVAQEAHVISQIEVEGSILQQAHTDVNSILEQHTKKASYSTKEWVESRTSVVKPDLDIRGKSYLQNAEFLKQIENWPAAKIAADKIPAEMGVAKYATGDQTVGMKWQKGSNNVRVSQGKPLAKNDCQKVDYVHVTYNGKVVSQDGNYIVERQGVVYKEDRVTGVLSNPRTDLKGKTANHPEAHIEVKIWGKWKYWYKPE